MRFSPVPANKFIYGEKALCSQQRKNLSGYRLHTIGLLG
jgi:hypothetical protein